MDMDKKMTETKTDAIDWSKYRAVHGSADLSIEVEGKSEGFFKRLFSGPPPKEKIGTIAELLTKLDGDDESEALKAYHHIAQAVCRNEFVTSAAAPAYPFILKSLEKSVSEEKFKLADHLLELLRGFAINIYRKTTVPKGEWADELDKQLKESISLFKQLAEHSQIEDGAKQLVNVLEMKPPEIFKLEEEIDWLDKGDIRYVNESSEGELEEKLKELGFKIYGIDCTSVELEGELLNRIATGLEFGEDELDQPEEWSWPAFIDTIHNEFKPAGVHHVAVICSNLSSYMVASQAACQQEIENIAMAAQFREDSILDGPVQVEFFFSCANEQFDEIKTADASNDKRAKCLEPNNVDFHRTKALRAVDKEDFELALNHYARAIELEPTDFSFYRERAQLYRILERYDEAIADCTKALEIDEGSMAHCERARSNLALEQYDKVIEDCQHEIELAADDESASWVPYQLIAEANLGLEKYADALESANHSLKIQVTKEGLLTRAKAKENLDQEEEAKQDRAKAEETAHGDPGIL